MSQDLRYVDSHIATAEGSFKIRVYDAPKGSETVVLWAEPLDVSKPVLTRIHSECMTGDLFGSQRCDCGEQLHRSLAMISREGGVLVYLRQEGRGIGLFDKIRSYQLQDQGMDTYEANIKLGHKPDERTFEMAKTTLDDLGITAIRLLTNNPDKIGKLTDYGIHVAERVPLVIEPNPNNKRYLDTKRDKFNHLLP